MNRNLLSVARLSSPAALPLLLFALLLSLLSAGCGTKKNTPVSRQWQAFTTRYNVYFNGSEHYKEQLKNMEEKYEDDYTRTLLTHPAEARGDNKRPQPTGEFKRTIEKMQKAIQLHSISKKPAKRPSNAKEKAFRAREEFNPFLHNAWLTLGRAQYMNGDFLGAASTFLYISKHFTWLPTVVTEARLWQARCYCALNWLYEADNTMRLVKEKDLTNKSLLNLYNLTLADYYVRAENYEAAIKPLTAAAKAASGTQKNRLWFLLGQIYSQLGQRQNAYEAYRKAGAGASTPYRTKFNARIKQSEVYAGTNIRKEVNSLKALTRYERNKEYLDQIYYAIGNLYLSRGDSAEAKKNYIIAIEKSTRNGIDKAMAQLALGNIYFSERDYVKAQPCYSEAVPQLPDNYPDYQKLRLRSDVLDELSLYAGNVHLQDSLLTLSEMTPEQQREACQKIVDELIKKEKEAEEEARKQEYLANQQGAPSPMDKNAATPGISMNTDKSWYFYNAMTKNAGKTEFQRKWGARKLEDDWRRRNKATFSLDEDEETDSGEEGDEQGENMPNDSTINADGKKVDDTDPHNVEFYLKQIPSTPEEKETANEIIQEGLYNMGVILKDKLEDFPAAREEFNRLDSRYPDNVYRLDIYYNMYLMAVRENNQSLAEEWRQKILHEFPDSPYGQAMLDPNYFNNLRRMHELQENLYETAYKAYLADDNVRVHELTDEMQTDYPLSPILPKFVFIDALSYLTEKDSDKFKERLTELLQKWPDTDMTDMAAGILKGLREGREPNSGMSNSRGMIWDTRLSRSDSTAVADGEPANFKRDPDAPQYLVFAFPRDEVNANKVLYDIARFNFSSFVVKDFDLEQMSFSNIGLLIVKGFANLREVEHYRTVMERSDMKLPEEVRPIMISRHNFEILLKGGYSFEEYFRFEEKADIENTEEELLGPDMTMPVPEGIEKDAEEQSSEEESVGESQDESSEEESVGESQDESSEEETAEEPEEQSSEKEEAEEESSEEASGEE